MLAAGARKAWPSWVSFGQAVCGELDLDAIGRGRWDGVHAAYLFRNIPAERRDAALAEVWELLAPGGWLVGGECQRLFPGQTIPVELIFEQLASFTDVVLEPGVRSSHGFLSPEQWQQALAATGFVELTEVPALMRIRDRYPRFFSGALCARQPATPGAAAVEGV